MNAKSYLMQAQLYEIRLKNIDALIRSIRAEIRAIGTVDLKAAWPDGQPHGTNKGDPTGTLATAMADSYSAKLEQLKKMLVDYEHKQIIARSEYWKKKMEIAESIGKVEDPTHCRILNMRYVEMKTFEEIAVEIGYTYRHTIRLHGTALKEYERMVDDGAGGN